MTSLLLVMLGGALGAVARYLVDRAVPAFDIPVATLAVNVAGSFVLGVLTGAGSAAGGPVGHLVGTGFCGALTTWSALAVQTVSLPSWRSAALNVTATLVIGFGAVVLGRALGSL